MDWNALAEAVIKVWNEIGWWAVLICIMSVLAYKALDTWGKRPK